MLGEYEMLDGNPQMLDEDFTKMFEVTSAQMQAAAKKYLTAERRDALVIQPAAAKGGEHPTPMPAHLPRRRKYSPNDPR